MTSLELNTMASCTSNRLPGWWRQFLIASATLVLCSCRGPALPIGGEADYAAALAPLLVAQATDDGAGAAADSRTTPPEPIAPADLGETIETLAPAAIEVAPLPPVVIPHDGIMVETGIGPPLPVLPHSCPVCLPGGAGAFGVDAAAAYLVGPFDEWLCDGGDFGTPAGVHPDWAVEGVEQEDTIAHYDTLDGRVVIVPSNRVCIYAPRFAAVRRVVHVMAHERGLFIEQLVDRDAVAGAGESQPVASSLQRHAVGIHLGQRPPSIFRERQQAGGLENLQATMDVFNSVAAYANLQIVRTGQVDNAEKPRLAKSIESAVTWTGDQAAQVVFDAKMAVAIVSERQVGVIYQADEPDAPRLRLVKLASHSHALPGEEVEFTLRYDNVGDQLIGNVTIVDNLATRLEYLPSSAQSSVDATLITAPNTGGSTILRWEIRDPVEPGEGGVLRFRARVR